MKIRNGFVSNSSSSSFIVIGKRIYSHQLRVGDFVVGRELCEGRDGFTISNKKMLEYVINHSEYFYHFFTDVRLIGEGSADVKIDARDIGNEAYAIEKDYYSSESIEKLKENYKHYEN